MIIWPVCLKQDLLDVLRQLRSEFPHVLFYPAHTERDRPFRAVARRTRMAMAKLVMESLGHGHLDRYLQDLHWNYHDWLCDCNCPYGRKEQGHPVIFQDWEETCWQFFA